MRTIGKRIALAREALGLNQSELARELNVTPQSVQAWEADKNVPRPKKIEALAAVLKTSISHLMGETETDSTGWTTQIAGGGKVLKGAAASNFRAQGSMPLLDEIVRKAFESGSLQTRDIDLLTTMAKALIERNKSAGVDVPHLPEELEALAESAFSNAQAGGDSEDMVKMIGHGLKKSGAKESSSRNAKRKTGSD